ncbi:MAG TPA: alpha/beta fold hydrolase [Pseudonocardiaceae bacterium]
MCTAVLAGIGVLVGVAAPASAANDDHATTAGFRPAPISWQPCPEAPNDPTVRCGTVRVPVDWARPRGATFDLAVAKRSATDPTHVVGPLLINPGGPGGSGVDFALAANRFFSPNLLAHFDVIGWDPRGVARSSPVRCSTALLNQAPFPVPATSTEFAALLAYNARLGADCRAHTGPLFDHVDTLSTVRDVDAIRAALGEHQISYYGVSYGTLIGQEFAERFPDRIRAMVIDSNMDHSLGTAPFLRTEAATDQDAFGQFVAWCARDSFCVLHGQDVNAIWAGLMRRADAGTLTRPGTTLPLTWFDLTAFAVNNLYGPTWSALAAGIAQLKAEPATRFAATPTLSDFPLPIFCEDWSLPASGFHQVRQLFAQSQAVAPQLRVSSLAWGVWTACLNFPVPVNDPQHVLRVHNDFPLLEINSVHDPATPYAWAVDDAHQLGQHARFVTYLGWGHGAYPHSACTIGTVDSYLISRTLPPVGMACPAVPPPDQVSANASPLLPVPNSVGF